MTRRDRLLCAIGIPLCLAAYVILVIIDPYHGA